MNKDVKLHLRRKARFNQDINIMNDGNVWNMLKEIHFEGYGNW